MFACFTPHFLYNTQEQIHQLDLPLLFIHFVLKQCEVFESVVWFAKKKRALQVKMPMSLLELPPEIIIQVMEYVGSPYFHEDIGRAMICKRWLKFARIVVSDHFVRLSPTTLRQLLSSPDAESTLLMIQKKLEILEFEMTEPDDWSSFRDLRVHSRYDSASYPATSCGTLEKSLPVSWKIKLNDDLLQLANLAKKSRKLHSVRIKAAIIVCDPSCGYLSASTIRSFLPVDNLMALDLDFRGTSLSNRPGYENSDDIHICKSIGVLLTTLTRLRLRMRDICTDALKPKNHPGSKLRLKEVIINLSLSYVSRMATTKVHSTPCSFTSLDYPERKVNGLQAEIKNQARALVSRMESPKLFRILTHGVTRLEPLSFDILTGKLMKLTEQMAWEADGEIQEILPSRYFFKDLNLPN